MPIALTAPEEYPPSPEARITAIAANVENRTLVVVVAFGRVVDGQFRPFREVRHEFTLDSTPSFLEVIQAVPEFRDLRRALETYLVNLGRLSGVVA